MREKILAVLEKNARIDIHELAMLLGESEVAVANEIADMEKENIIRGYHTLINWENTSNERIAERIYQYNEVDSVYLMSGAFDFMVLLEGKTMREVAFFVSERLAPIESVTGTSTHFVLKKYKDHGTEMVRKKEDERQLFMA